MNEHQESVVDEELMAFALLRREERRARREATEAALAGGAAAVIAESPESDDVEFVESAEQSASQWRERPIELEVVEDFYPSPPKRLHDIPPSAAGAEMASEEDSYAIRRVLELRKIATATKTLEPTDETLKAAAEARLVNIAAFDDAKPRGPAAGKGVPRTAKSATR